MKTNRLIILCTAVILMSIATLGMYIDITTPKPVCHTKISLIGVNEIECIGRDCRYDDTSAENIVDIKCESEMEIHDYRGHPLFDDEVYIIGSGNCAITRRICR